MSTGGPDDQATGGEAPKRRRSPRGDVGTTGARFGSPAVRKGLDELPDDPPDQPRRRRSSRGDVGTTGARFGSAALRRGMDDEPVEEDAGDLESTAPFSGHFDDVQPEPEHDPGSGPVLEWSGPLVRPYAWTRGRTSSEYDLRLETLVSLAEGGMATAMRDTTSEQRAIVQVCAQTRSVAEVSALLSLPLGVVRVLLGDLIGMGVVTMHRNAAASGGPDLRLMERVLQGLRNL